VKYGIGWKVSGASKRLHTLAFWYGGNNSSNPDKHFTSSGGARMSSGTAGYTETDLSESGFLFGFRAGLEDSVLPTNFNDYFSKAKKDGIAFELTG